MGYIFGFFHLVNYDCIVSVSRVIVCTQLTSRSWSRLCIVTNSCETVALDTCLPLILVHSAASSVWIRNRQAKLPSICH